MLAICELSIGTIIGIYYHRYGGEAFFYTYEKVTSRKRQHACYTSYLQKQNKRILEIFFEITQLFG